MVEVPQSNTMRKHSTDNKCNACDKRFRKSQDLDKHMDDKHTEKQCTFCDTTCDNKAELVKHHRECIDRMLPAISLMKNLPILH